MARSAASASANSRSKCSMVAGGPSRRGALNGRSSSPRASASSYNMSTTACARLREGYAGLVGMFTTRWQRSSASLGSPLSSRPKSSATGPASPRVRISAAASRGRCRLRFALRGRTAKRNLQRPREAAAEILTRGEAGPVALLFGREDKGLPNEALDRCHRVVNIPTSPAYPSLNLAHAVVLMLYELALARGDEDRPFKAPRREGPPATMEHLERLFADAEAALRAIDFFKTRQAEGVMRTLREVIHRTPLDEREAKLLRAMAIEVVKYGERLARNRLHVDR